MDNYRIYGYSPFNIAVIHGGPGLPGDMAMIARELSTDFGVIEPFQTKGNINSQVQELYKVIKDHSQYPVKLIGHSWGAWLAYIFTFYYPDLVEKLIMVGAGAFEEKYNKDLSKTRMDRLTPDQKTEILRLLKQLDHIENEMPANKFKRIGELMSAADSFNRLENENDIIEYQPHIFQAVWNEAQELRKNGSLLEMGMKIQCPVLALHGDYDPHPYKGVSEPLSKVVKDFRFFLLKKCGHYPWKERFAKDQFFGLLKKEL